jgi:hypothetical protein
MAFCGAKDSTLPEAGQNKLRYLLFCCILSFAHHFFIAPDVLRAIICLTKPHLPILPQPRISYRRAGGTFSPFIRILNLHDFVGRSAPAKMYPGTNRQGRRWQD